MSKLVIKNIHGQGSAGRVAPHTGIKNRPEKQAGQKRVVFLVLGRGDKIDNGFLLPESLQ